MIRDAAQDILRYIRTRIWLQAQWPDPEVVYRRGGMLAIANLLRQTSSPGVTNDVLRRFGADIHPDCHPIGPGITVHEYVDSFKNLKVGAHVHIGKEVFLDLTDKIIIEDSVGVGMRVVILTHLILGDYPNKPISKMYPRKIKPTILRRGCSIGAGSVIASGVEIGEDAIVNANVLVDRDVPPRTVVHSTTPRKHVRLPDRLFEKYKST